MVTISDSLVVLMMIIVQYTVTITYDKMCFFPFPISLFSTLLLRTLQLCMHM